MKEQHPGFKEQLRLQRTRRLEEELAQDETAVQEHLRILERMLDEAQDAMLLTEGWPVSGQGPRIQYVNLPFTRLTGYRADEIVGKTLRLLEADNESPAGREFLAMLKKGQTARAEMSLRHKDNSAFPASVSVTPVTDSEGEVTHWIHVLSDLSEKHAMEEASRRIERVESRNHSLAEELAKRRNSEERLAYAAFHDSLTGLRNRDYFMDRLEETLRRTQTRSDTKSFVVYLDLDGFKRVNDELGHSVGDQVLQEVAERLRSCCRPQDTLARLGGDEFTILLTNVKSEQASALIVQRLQRELTRPYAFLDAGYAVTASMGLCEVLARYERAEEILRDADVAMYRAKQQGGAQSVSFDEGMETRAVAMRRNREQLAAALKEGKLRLAYQPVVDMRSHRMVAVEALLRWPEAEGELTEPRAVVALAEECGLGADLCNWVLRESTAQWQRWREDRPQARFALHVNVSRQQLDAVDFAVRFADLVVARGMDCSSMQFDLTEDVLLQTQDATAACLRDLRRMGVRVALDDFGSARLSLADLESYPIDMVKLDISLTRGLKTLRAGKNVARSVIDVASGLGLRVVAEGVEQETEEAMLNEMGCSTAQGFLYSQPCSADEIERTWLPAAF